jgi:hypothetical protein
MAQEHIQDHDVQAMYDAFHSLRDMLDNFAIDMQNQTLSVSQIDETLHRIWMTCGTIQISAQNIREYAYIEDPLFESMYWVRNEKGELTKRTSLTRASEHNSLYTYEDGSVKNVAYKHVYNENGEIVDTIPLSVLEEK